MVEFDVKVGGGKLTSTTVYATNDGTIFGEIDNNAIEFLNLAITDGDYALDSVEQSVSISN